MFEVLAPKTLPLVHVVLGPFEIHQQSVSVFKVFALGLQIF